MKLGDIVTQLEVLEHFVVRLEDGVATLPRGLLEGCGVDAEAGRNGRRA